MSIKIKVASDRYAVFEFQNYVMLLERPQRGVSFDRDKAVSTLPPATTIALKGNHSIDVPFDLVTTYAIIQMELDENGEPWPDNVTIVK